jgi:2',3'-cyclic-nucleotide 2'-phosphodiesterase (5'-nucleotidase family)
MRTILRTWLLPWACALLLLIGAASSTPQTQRPTPSIPKGSVGIAFSGQLEGYLTPCGCSKPMIGGMPRRANLLKGLSPAVRLENGDLTPAAGRQDELKAETALDMFNLMHYDAINLGEEDFALGMDYLRSLQARFQGTLLCGNVCGPDGKPLFADKISVEREVDGKKTRVVIVGLISDSFGDLLRARMADAAIQSPESVLERLAPTLATEGSVRVLLYHGPKAEAESLVQRFPLFQVVVTAHDSDDPTPPKPVGAAQLVSLGKDGKHVGLASVVVATGAVKVTDTVLAPELGENPDSVAAMSVYGERVAAEGLLALVPKTASANGDTYAGTAACATCHADQMKVWSNSKHATAYATLVTEKHDRDPECVSCHVVGLQTVGGFIGHKETAHLENVGCESCHGPAAKHAQNPATKLAPATSASCQSCHVPEHSPRFDFANYWKMIRH